MVLYSLPNGGTVSLRVVAPAVYISPSSSVDVQLHTCHRFDPTIPQGMELESVYEPSSEWPIKHKLNIIQMPTTTCWLFTSHSS